MKKTLLTAFSVLALFSFILIGPRVPAENSGSAGGSFTTMEHGIGY
ncbi:hypothetical protein SAMN05216191_11474 [Paenibacillus jilunlii]|uniref:Phr family secreted Rap phosphatase inhibitor n=1 Tax=Paenibacillus jilunlii TaxID=682956 RepID=A0A1G9U962_9BACL|nr:hypothetical protein SAMN05216191_11474 [Paenibacillus jilunlii]